MARSKLVVRAATATREAAQVNELVANVQQTHRCASLSALCYSKKLVLCCTDCVFQRSRNTSNAAYLLAPLLACWPCTCLRIRLFVYLAKLHLCYRLSSSLSMLIRAIFLFFQHASQCNREHLFHLFSLNTTPTQHTFLASSSSTNYLHRHNHRHHNNNNRQLQHQHQQQNHPPATLKLPYLEEHHHYHRLYL